MSSFYAEVLGQNGSYKFFLDNEWRESASGKQLAILNPSTNAPVYSVQACTKAEVDEAFQSAKRAQKTWARTPLWRRAEFLHKVAALMRENAQPIADVLVKEVAKPAVDAYTEVVRSADLISYTAEEGLRYFGEGKLLASDSFPGQDRTKLCMASKVPLGVVLAIPPFNYAINLAVSKIGPALMAGNSVVLKPPTQGSVANLLMVQCFAAAGMPPGLINCVTGRGSEIGDYLTTHPLVNAISFTGGDTGIDIARKAGMVPIQMELGGKDAAIVCADADLAATASHIVKGAFSYSGQRCTAVKLVLVEECIADELVPRVVEGVKRMSVGMPEDNKQITPVISESSANFIEGLVRDAEAKGATLCTGPFRREGNLIWPVVVDNVTPDMRLAWEEPFGPVLPIVRVKDTQEAVEHVNANRLALQGCVFTKDIDRAIAIADAMETGSVQINSAPARGPDHFPFQGFRDSGIGSQGVTNSLAFMCKTKTTVINMPKPSFTMG
ncbi:hypothetical protein COHA_003510 [Chlorella ohadii]|uniref:NADP-dependent glyceraldehyde-3-phosphate dehydrogenase n=1 Tax=Chlorella ohadii TaxID=2649997 RepID=A0AAD5DR70_9CHLO|nr:hypothetical protein COHA_003510 [Chlorella ohadii]